MITVQPRLARLLMVPCVLFSLLLLTACDEKQMPSGGYGDPIQANVMLPIQKEVAEYDEFTGRFRASQRVEVRARVSGYLEKVNFEPGRMVEKDQVLFVIDQRPFQIEMDSAAAQYERARKEHDRAKQLRQSKAISQEAYDSRLQEMLVAKAALEHAKLNLEFTIIKAPFAGRISRNYVDVGNLISGGSSDSTLLTTIVQVQPIHFYFEGSETDVLRYIRTSKKLGKASANRDNPWPVELKLQDETEYVHKGTLNFVDNELNFDTGTKEARAVFLNEEAVLEPGLFARLRLATTQTFSAFLLPDTAIGSEQTRKYVYVVGPEQKATRKYLTLGKLQDDGMRIVKDGLQATDQVIVGNLQRLQPGAVVQPVLGDDQNPKEGY